MHGDAPRFHTTLIGRDDDLAALLTLLDRHRLVTLVGAGGVGKTRLAVRAVEMTSRRRTFVDLAAVDDAAHVTAAFARGLGIAGPNADEAAVISALVDDDRTLLVDNAEHVAAAVAALTAQVLSASPRVSILVTSRRALGVDGEALFDVTPLRPRSAIELFLERARALAPEVATSDADRERIAAICRRLDGIPLAIEIVAARARGFALRDLFDSIDDRSSSLRDHRLGTPQRHQTIDDSVEWSWRLLAENERVLLARLAVFPAAFSIDAARAVASADDDTLLALVDHSLVHVVDRTTESRYRILEVVRPVVRAHLSDEEASAAHDRLVTWCLAQLAIPVSTNPHELAAVDRELPSYRTAMRWSLENDRHLDGLRIAIALAQYWETRDCAEGLAWLVPLREGVGAASAERAYAARVVSHAAFFRGDFALSREMEGEAAQYAELVGDANLLGAATKGIAWAERALLDPAARHHFEVAAERLRQTGDVASLCDALGGIAETAWADNRVVEGVAAAEAAVVEARRGDPATQLQMLTFVGMGACLSGAIEHATASLDEAYELGRRIDDALWLPVVELLLARVVAIRGDPETAHAQLLPVLARAEASGIVIGLAIGWWARGLSSYESGAGDRALEELETGAGVGLFTAFPYLSAELSATRARMLVARGEHDLARAACDEAAAASALPFGAYGRPPALVARSSLDAASGRFADALVAAYDALHLATGGGSALHVALALGQIGEVRMATGQADDGARLIAAAGDGSAPSLADGVALAMRGRGRRGRPAAGWESLTPAEHSVVQLVQEGLTNREIAAKLYVAQSTVKTHLSSVFSKLGVTSRAELAATAARQG